MKSEVKDVLSFPIVKMAINLLKVTLVFGEGYNPCCFSISAIALQHGSAHGYVIATSHEEGRTVWHIVRWTMGADGNLYLYESDSGEYEEMFNEWLTHMEEDEKRGYIFFSRSATED